MFTITDYGKASRAELRQELIEFHEILTKEAEADDQDRAARARIALGIFRRLPHQMNSMQLESMRKLMAMKEPSALRDFSGPINEGALSEEGVIKLMNLLQEIREDEAEVRAQEEASSKA